MMNFEECRKEPIEIPGKIQSFGYLIGLDAASKRIKFVSENLNEIFYYRDSAALLGHKLEVFSDIFLKILWSDNYKKMDFLVKTENQPYLETILLDSGQYYFTLLRTGATVYLAFERIVSSGESYNLSTTYNDLFEAKDADEIWQRLLRNFDEIIGFDRMVVYQFQEDFSGVVIAERKKPEAASLLGLHYPEYNIPQQARELYLKKRNTLCANSYAEPVALISQGEENYDLTYLDLRAVSPRHNYYLQEMAVATSFHTVMIVDGKLWGMVLCHNFEPKVIDYSMRSRCEILSTVAARSYAISRSRAMMQHELGLGKHREDILSKLLSHSNVNDALKQSRETIWQMVESDGLAIFSLQDELITVGQVPEEATLVRMANFVRSQAKSGQVLFQDQMFAHHHPEVTGSHPAACGLMAAGVGEDNKILFLWLRKATPLQMPELVRTEFPDRLQEIGIKNVGFGYSPLYGQEGAVKVIDGQSRPWKEEDQKGAEVLQNLVLETAYSYLHKVNFLNQELNEVSELFDNFSSTVSHDLATPLTVLKLNTQQMLQRAAPDSREHEKLTAMLHQINRMAEIIEDSLQLTRSRLQTISLQSIQPGPVVENLLTESLDLYGSPTTQTEVGRCPPVLADRTFVNQVFMNVINNAVKYSSSASQPQVKIWGEETAAGVEYHIQDNGVGIPADEQTKIFKPFSRASSASVFKGMGVGLSIVKSVMEKMGGSIRFSSTPGRDTVFTLTFQKP